MAQVDVTDAQLDAASRGQTIRVGSVATGRIATLPLETYVARVLAGEGEARAADAAQQALAIAIRTFALANQRRHRHEGFDLCDTTHCQVLRAATASSRQAALVTAGRILTYNGQPAEIFYSASCGGHTEDAAQMWPGADYPYLQGVDDDVHDGDAPWTIEFTLDDVRQALRRSGFAGDRLRSVRVDTRSPSGRVTRLSLSGLRPDVITGDQFRMALGAAVLRSTAFDMETRGNVLRFTGRGYGHGVGLCVIGAGRRALRGESAEAILAKYFPGLVFSGAAILPEPAGAVAGAPDVRALVARAHDELSRVLGTSVAPITVELHPSLESFRLATGRPWWVSVATSGTAIELAPAAVLAQREGVADAVRVGVAEVLVSGPLAGRAAWIRIGAARYYAHGAANRVLPAPRQCPSDAELMLAISAAAQREAEAAAEACFARALHRARSWRDVR
jgi:stage II sporulation protein D